MGEWWRPFACTLGPWNNDCGVISSTHHNMRCINNSPCVAWLAGRRGLGASSVAWQVCTVGWNHHLCSSSPRLCPCWTQSAESSFFRSSRRSILFLFLTDGPVSLRVWSVPRPTTDLPRWLPRWWRQAAWPCWSFWPPSCFRDAPNISSRSGSKQCWTTCYEQSTRLVLDCFHAVFMDGTVARH